MKTRNTLLPAISATICSCLALASCVEIGVGVPYHHGPPGYGRGVEVIAPGTHVTVGAPDYLQVLPSGARPVTYRGEQCWVYGGRHYRRYGRGYAPFVP